MAKLGIPQARSSNGMLWSTSASNVGGTQPLEHEGSHEAKLRREEFVRSLPNNIQESVTTLEGFDDEIAALEAQFRRERRQLERKYEALYAPIFLRRASLVAGEMQGKAMVAGFWLNALKAETAVAGNIMPHDEPALTSLRDITCITLHESKGMGFCLQFLFAANPYFSNNMLAKTYHMAGTDTEPILRRAEGTEIRWKSGMNLTTKQQRLSFFNFFNTFKLPLEESCMDEWRDTIDADYEIGRAFKDKLVPHAIRWFTGEAEDAQEFASPEDAFDNEGMPLVGIGAYPDVYTVAAADEKEAALQELRLEFKDQ